MSKRNHKAAEAAEATPESNATRAKEAKKAQARGLQAIVNYSRGTTVPDSEGEGRKGRR
ncbi:hypothetical protein [Streptomyces sp. NPDC059708]|uniref:hypothetical protein n=1 Tax=Streptomyces sp. NPDC059708 TaxID=3346916 RepID=UPI00367DB6AE